MNLSAQSMADFVQTVKAYFNEHRRNFDWRENTEPYRIFVSEIMLQQTQTTRVAQKFPGFLQRFPDFQRLAGASLAEVLGEWQGLGYNRRGRYLHESAGIIYHQYQGILPADRQTLQGFPGIGPNTAASILAFAYNIPEIFIETNIRSVFIHHFFTGGAVHDREILPLIAASLDQANPREWYWALMDYGVFLKKTQGNAARKSVHYTRQSAFEGSVRQARGRILKIILEKPEAGVAISELPPFSLYAEALAGLAKEGMIVAEGSGESQRYRIRSGNAD